MRSITLYLIVAGAVALVGCAHATTTEPAMTGVQWGPAPAVFPAGAQMAVMGGDPTKAGQEFTIRLRLPDGYKLAPHTHPTDENVTVLAGSFSVGMGTTFDGSALQALPVGGFVTAPAEHAHYAQAHGTTIVQVSAIGPFALTYVNPADNPATSASR